MEPPDSPGRFTWSEQRDVGRFDRNPAYGPVPGADESICVSSFCTPGSAYRDLFVSSVDAYIALLLRRKVWPVLAGVKLVPARARVAVAAGAPT